MTQPGPRRRAKNRVVAGRHQPRSVPPELVELCRELAKVKAQARALGIFSETVRWGFVPKTGNDAEKIGAWENPIVTVDGHVAFVSALFNRSQAGIAEMRRAVRLFTINYDTLLEDALALGCFSHWDGFTGVHAREVVSEAPRVVFPGNLQGRHANETGAKGCELVTVEAGRIESEFVALDVVRWHQVVVPADGLDRLEALGDAFREALEPVLAGVTDRLHAVRVTLTGSTALHRLE